MVWVLNLDSQKYWLYQTFLYCSVSCTLHWIVQRHGRTPEPIVKEKVRLCDFLGQERAPIRSKYKMYSCNNMKNYFRQQICVFFVSWFFTTFCQSLLFTLYCQVLYFMISGILCSNVLWRDTWCSLYTLNLQEREEEGAGPSWKAEGKEGMTIQDRENRHLCRVNMKAKVTSKT